MIDHWLKINDVYEFKTSIEATIQDMYLTIIRKKEVQQPLVIGEEFRWAALDSPQKV